MIYSQYLLSPIYLFIAFIVLLSIFGFSQFLAFDKSWLIQIPLSIYFNQYS